MPWFTFHRPSPEALAVADSIRANYQTFLQRPEWPRASAATFLRYDHATGETHFYFSPAFAEAEPFMVELYLASVCSPPQRQVGLALLVGQFGGDGASPAIANRPIAVRAVDRPSIPTTRPMEC